MNAAVPAAAAVALLLGSAGGYVAGRGTASTSTSASPTPPQTGSPSTSPSATPTATPAPTPSPSASERCPGELLSQLDLNRCAFDEWRREQRTLAAVYAAARAEVPPAERRVLERTQREWAATTEAFCGVVGVRDGTIHPMIEGFCLADHTRERSVAVCVWWLDGDNPDAGPPCGPLLAGKRT